MVRAECHLNGRFSDMHDHRQTSSTVAPLSAWRRAKAICSFVKRLRGMAPTLLQSSGCPKNLRSTWTSLLGQGQEARNDAIVEKQRESERAEKQSVSISGSTQIKTDKRISTQSRPYSDILTSTWIIAIYSRYIIQITSVLTAYCAARRSF